MFGHEVIRDFQFILKNINRAEKIGEYQWWWPDKTQQELMKFMIEEIRDSHHFHIGNFNDLQFLYETSLKDTSDVPFMGELANEVNLPYQKCWFDYIYDISNHPQHSRKSKFGFNIKHGLCVTLEGYIRGNELLRIIPAMITPDQNGTLFWVPFIRMYYVLVGSNFELEESKLILRRSFKKPDEEFIERVANMLDGRNVMSLPMIHPQNADKVSSDYKGIESKVVNGMLSTLNSFLLVLNCQNVYTENIARTKDVFKKHKKRKVPDKRLFEYKVLALKLPKSSKKHDTKLYQGGTVRLHFRRGHPKTYTEDAPLFGKYVGRWWWQSGLVGDKEKGFVGKEYDIKTPEPDK